MSLKIVFSIILIFFYSEIIRSFFVFGKDDTSDHSKALLDNISHIYGQKYQSSHSKMASISQFLAYNSSREGMPDYPSIFMSSNVTFDDRKREDAFDKRPASESPHAVLIIMTFGQDQAGICSGSLLTPDWVLTAGHCLRSPDGGSASKILVYAGGYSLNEVKTNQLAKGSQVRHMKIALPHPKYKGQQDYDVGLIKVDESFKMTDTVNTAEISTQPWNYRGYRQCKLTGFGNVRFKEKSPDDQVRKTHTLDVKQPCLCSFRLKIVFGTASVRRMICARPLQDYGPCRGDSGGGLLCGGQLRAVTSSVVQLLETNTCEVELIPDVKCGSAGAINIFQDTCPFLHWINDHVQLFNSSQISEECVEWNAASSPLRGGALFLLIVFVDVIII